MTRHLNIVESDFENLEKKILPRFPFCYLTFRGDNDANIYEVKDISHSGMQLELKDGEIQSKRDDIIDGVVHWKGAALNITGKIVWHTQARLGVAFKIDPSNSKKLDDFLSPKHLATHLIPIHEVNCGVEIPPTLKYWLRSDGPVEVFIWCHPNGEFSEFQIVMMENLVEWKDGLGIRTARVISKRNINTPLINEDEFMFHMDEGIDEERLTFATQLVSELKNQYLTQETKEFLLRKLR